MRRGAADLTYDTTATGKLQASHALTGALLTGDKTHDLNQGSSHTFIFVTYSHECNNFLIGLNLKTN